MVTSPGSARVCASFRFRLDRLLGPIISIFQIICVKNYIYLFICSILFYACVVSTNHQKVRQALKTTFVVAKLCNYMVAWRTVAQKWLFPQIYTVKEARLSVNLLAPPEPIRLIVAPIKSDLSIWMVDAFWSGPQQPMREASWSSWRCCQATVNILAFEANVS